MVKPIGVCVGEPSTREVDFISSEIIQLGDYVELEYEGYKVLGFVKEIKRVNKSLTEDLEPEDVEHLKTLIGKNSFFWGKISLLGDVDKKMFIPRIPPEPGTNIFRASKETLQKVFGKNDDRKIHIGHLLTREDVDVFIDIDSIVSRHLAILAVTGGGKSNTVSVILEGMLDKFGTILVFDMHGEYVNFDYRRNGKPCVRRIDLELNPTRLSYHEFRLFANVDDSAYIQDRYLRRAFKITVEEIQNGQISASNFWGRLLGELYRFLEEEPKDYQKSIIGIISKVEDMKDLYANLFNLLQTPIVDQIEFGKLNVIDLSHVDEKIADIVVSHVLRNILEKRKAHVRNETGGLEFPVFMILEEAHILASSTINTKSRYWISRIAREGRKFGLGLCLVTQRPKALDSNALSQANNMIILRLVEPGDQRHVQQASESLSSDLVDQLPSLNVGEALIMGKMIPVPALVKIKLARSKKGGNDISAVSEWKKYKESTQISEKDLSSFLELGDTEF
ncbi:helicase HerA-like domain-containing protein [Desulfurobacterium thermolithotrophum]|uniref:helicase HerA-like domain-containing protein n=1 Tax=Desulfurobacterium thermolithotrophum TaxID=64160 RepID=UPI0013D6C299|nr:ATP-binding protein [Desulfurobacterium thermolithotrophum]